jgi:hypothetical protein
VKLCLALVADSAARLKLETPVAPCYPAVWWQHPEIRPRHGPYAVSSRPDPDDREDYAPAAVAFAFALTPP